MIKDSYFKVVAGPTLHGAFAFVSEDRLSTQAAWIRANGVLDSLVGIPARIVVWRLPPIPGPWRDVGIVGYAPCEELN